MSAAETILGCILAGGLSRRMGGGDKTLRELGGKPMLAHVIDRMKPQVDALLLNANGAPERFDSFDLPVVADTIEGHAGPLAGVLAAMRHAERLKPSVSHVATAASDTPFLPNTLVAALKARADAHSDDTVVLAVSNGHRHPVFGLWPVHLADDLDTWMRASDNYKVLAWIDRHRLETVDFPMIETERGAIDPFFNANAPEDMLAAEAHWKDMTS